MQLPEADFRDVGMLFAIRYDSKDTATFAMHGLAAAVEYQRADQSLGADRDWERIEAGLSKALPIGKNVVWFRLAGGSDFGDELPADRAFSLGGPKTLPAYQYDELRVRNYGLAQAGFLWHLKDLAPIKGQAIYAGFGLQAAKVKDRVDPVEDGEIYGVSAYLAGPTPIGTFTLGIGATDDQLSFWLALGKPIGKGSIMDDGLFR